MIDIPNMKELQAEVRPKLFDSLEQRKYSPEELRDLDKPIIERLAKREAFEPLDDTKKKELKDLGYSEDVIEAVGSNEEADIYMGADLESKSLNDREVLVKKDIDLEQQDDFGATNLERMENGKPPLDKDGRPIELHHIGQKNDAPLAELSKSEHTGDGNDKVLHDKTKESEIDRTGFAKERAEHWQARAEDIKQQAGTENG
ncbi:HNH/ENDO VII family nuclease [Salinibius halmophilus]|uniref:HNH/ENDO VII family nuclease n=1 Tax=Salinibius halmophilus TaxID=1853216 RepID=UPI0018F2827E|nr:HNH/ENDO VII family nuclease [Salinibius halmophilus]